MQMVGYAMEPLFEDFEFIRSFFPRFVPCHVQLDPQKNKYKKVPAISGWTTITPEQSQEIISRQEYADHRYFMFLTGDGTGLFVIDIDRKNASRPDHANMIDGVEAFEMWCGPIEENPDTFTTRSIGGGYHKVYKLTSELAGKVKNGLLVPNVLCEVLYNGRGFMYGEGCKIIHKMLPQPPSNAVVNLMLNMNNCFNNNSVTINNNIGSNAINSLLGGDVDVSWDVTRERDDSYKLVPDTHRCCVDMTTEHTYKGHSCIYVGRTSVVLNCFSHGKKLLSGDMSKRIRSMFFDYAEQKQKGGVLEIVERIKSIASEERLARDGGNVLRRVSDLVPVYEHVCTYEKFLTSRLVGSVHLDTHPKKFNDLMVYMTRVDNESFPFISKDRNYIGFTNGMLNIASGELEDYRDLPSGVTPRHYIPQACTFDDDDLDTPLFDKIFKYQLEDDEESYVYLLGLIGRLFYDVGQFDNFDVMPLVVGDTNTGKSTLTDIISAMFAQGSVGVVDSSHETIFGLHSMRDKEVIVSPEMPENLAHILSSDKFKKMICGEIVTVPIKHSVAQDIRWKVPMFMCGNDYPIYNDKRGSVSKRLAIFSFTKYVREQDSSLKHRIIGEELSALVIKCLRAYREILRRTGTKGFWDACPETFKDNISDMHETTDYVYMFLTLGQGDNTWYDRVSNNKKSMYFVQKNDHLMWMEEFKKKFYDYMRFRHPTVRHRWTKDYSTFKRLGYVVDRRNMCRACKGPAVRGCCEDYSNANRSHVDIITNIVCVEEPV